MPKRKSPYRRIMEKLDMSDTQLAKKLKLAPSTVYRWGYPKERNGLGGIIPQEHHRRIKTLAQRRGIKLTAEDFLGV